MMPRLRLFTFATAASLLLAFVVAGLWVRSVSAHDHLRFTHATDYPDCDMVHDWIADSSAGGLRVSHHINHFKKGQAGPLLGWHFSSSGGPHYPFYGTRSRVLGRDRLTFAQRRGFEISNDSSGTPPSVVRGVILPHWFAIAVLMLPSAAWLRWGWRAVVRRRRAGAGLCPICGYDLRASGDRCPECGFAARSAGENFVAGNFSVGTKPAGVEQAQMRHSGHGQT